jgi:hypothetical protein
MNTPLNPHLRQTNVIGSAFCQSDFRLGNLVIIENDLLPETKNEIYRISGINARVDLNFPNSKFTVSLDHTNSIRTYSQFEEFVKPIELSTEWLLKMGFVKDQETDYRWFLEDWLTFDDDDNTIKISDTWEFGSRYYVHQIQNLYHSVKCVELVF